jgi:hypothetical protein
VSGDGNPVEFPSLRVQDRLPVISDFSYQFFYVVGVLGFGIIVWRMSLVTNGM